MPSVEPAGRRAEHGAGPARDVREPVLRIHNLTYHLIVKGVGQDDVVNDVPAELEARVRQLA